MEAPGLRGGVCSTGSTLIGLQKNLAEA
uniref:Uncharacterized protein n=1 Tax=Anguilla anguilla TaxID=7936 RepID=A0A0E9TS30_ANGAN